MFSFGVDQTAPRASATEVRLEDYHRGPPPFQIKVPPVVPQFVDAGRLQITKQISKEQQNDFGSIDLQVGVSDPLKVVRCLYGDEEWA